jgi:hypothetical protein
MSPLGKYFMYSAPKERCGYDSSAKGSKRRPAVQCLNRSFKAKYSAEGAINNAVAVQRGLW